MRSCCTRLAVLTAALLAAGFVGPAASGQATIGLNFNGTNLSQLPALNAGFEYIPPDTQGAIGPNHFAEFTNGTFAAYNKSTGALVGSRIALTTFWQNAGVTGLNLDPTVGTGTTDPHILYDRFSGRWFAATIDTPQSGVNRVLVGVSNSSDPTAGWKGFGITSSSSDVFADFPSLGINNDAIYISTNNFSNTGGSTNVGVLVVPKAALLAPTPNITGATLFDNQDPNTTGFTPAPAVDMDNGTGSIPLLSAYNVPSGVIKRSDINGTNTASPTLNTSRSLISVPAFGNPPSAHQSGANDTISTGDTRFLDSLVLQNGKIWGIENVNSAGRSALRWVRINASTNALEDSGVISDPARDLYYGSMAINDNGDIVVGFTGSSDSEFASAYAEVGKFNGSTTIFGSPMLLAVGTGNYNVTFGGAENRWGDYSKTTIDPNNDNVFWTIQEYASGINNWSTRITQISVPEPSCGAALAFSGLALLARRRCRTRV